MPAPAVVTLALAGLLVAALAAVLVWVVVLLRRILDTLGKVLFGVRAIAHRTGPLDACLTEVNEHLGEIADGIHRLDVKLGAGTAQIEASHERVAALKPRSGRVL
jgi:hypothetical protein